MNIGASIVLKRNTLTGFQYLQTCKCKNNTYLMVFFGDFCWHTLALIAALLTTDTVSTTTFHQQT